MNYAFYHFSIPFPAAHQNPSRDVNCSTDETLLELEESIHIEQQQLYLVNLSFQQFILTLNADCETEADRINTLKKQLIRI